MFFWSWQAVISAALLYWIAGSLGIGLGFHRLLTHRGYRVPKAVEYFLVLCGALALEGGPIQWATTHRIHHAHTDQEGEPHPPRDGRWWAHVGWILRGTAQLRNQAVLRHYAPDLMKDRFYVLLNRFLLRAADLSRNCIAGSWWLARDDLERLPARDAWASCDLAR